MFDRLLEDDAAGMINSEQLTMAEHRKLSSTVKSKHPKGNNSKEPPNILQENQFLDEAEAERTVEHIEKEGNPERSRLELGTLVEGMRPWVDTLEEGEHQLEADSDCSNSSSLNC